MVISDVCPAKTRTVLSRRGGAGLHIENIFKDDLGADSLDLFEMVMSLEESCGVEIPTEDLEQMKTVGDVVKYLEDHQ